MPQTTPLSVLSVYIPACMIVVNPSIAEQVGTDVWQISPSAGACDCGTVLGALSRSIHSIHVSSTSIDRMDERKLIQLRRQGWSERRIQRWMEQRQHADITKERAARVRDAQYRQSRDVIAAIDAWMRLIQAVIATGAAPWIGLLKHWYTGDIETEPVLIHARRIIPLAALSSETLLLMDEDVVYEFQP